MRKNKVHATVLALFLAASIAPHAMAGTAYDPAAGSSGTVIDTGLGALAAVGCGLFGRALMGGAVFPGVIAGAIATCGYMIWDGLTHDR